MGYEVISFKKEKEVPYNGGLMSREQRDSSSSLPKMKSLFSKTKFGKKKKDDGNEYQPPTAPSSPADDTPLNVSVIPNNPSVPYRMTTADTVISDITMLAASPHRVGFDPSTKAPSRRTDETLGSEAPRNNNELSLVTPSPADSDGSVWNKTLGMLDDICNVPIIGKKNLDNDMAAAVSPHANMANRPAWGSVPSADDDDTLTDQHSFESTLSPGFTTSTGFHSGGKGDATTKASTLPRTPEKTIQEHAAASPPMHENFEVVLDPTHLAAEPSASKRRGWFGKKDNEEEEEEKKSDVSDESKYVSSYATNHMANLESSKSEDTTSSSKKPSLIKLLSMVKIGKSKEEEGMATSSRFVDQPTPTSNSWNNATPASDPWDNSTHNAKSQLQAANKVKKAKRKKAKAESQEKSGKRSQSLGPFISKFKLPMAALRKKSMDDSVSGSTKSKSSFTFPVIQKRCLWKAVEDPASQRTYYYHRKTRKTTWKKPQELEDWENARNASTTVDEKEREVTLQETKDGGLAPEMLMQVPDASEVAVARVTSTKSTPVSSTRPPAVISAESQDQVEPLGMGINKSNTFDDTWEKKREINRLLTGLAPSDKVSVNRIMKDSAGNEDELLKQLRDLVESQPFDEPFLDEPDESLDEPLRSSSYAMTGRVRTHASRASATTKSSAKTDKTQKIKNTSAGRINTIAPISECMSTATSISSNHHDDNMYPGLPPPGSHLNKPIQNARIPSKVPAVPRNRELMIEEFTGSKAETFSVAGRVIRGGTTEDNAEDNYYADNEVDTYNGTDSVSALSEGDLDLLSRKKNFDQARRRALDDAVEREDWELAAVLTEGLRQSGGSQDVADAHNTWNQSSLNKFIANNDWSAVSGYIAQMLDGKNKELTPPNQDELVIPKPNKQAAVVAPIVRKKKIGSTSQLQHREIGSKSQLQPRTQLPKSQLEPRELLSESSWTTDSSYDSASYDSDYS